VTGISLNEDVGGVEGGLGLGLERAVQSGGETSGDGANAPRTRRGVMASPAVGVSIDVGGDDGGVGVGGGRSRRKRKGRKGGKWGIDKLLMCLMAVVLGGTLGGYIIFAMRPLKAPPPTTKK
jgi:hypothetical protein